ncbi:MAG TPA: DUF1905 domain-containing protein [Candidatus Nanopelagicaceae bacterium]
MAEETFTIKAKVWLYSHNESSWHFVSVPKKQSDYIRERFGSQKRGFGSIRVTASIGTTVWKTSIFPDSKSGTYFLPLKAEIRKKSKIEEGDTITFTLEI